MIPVALQLATMIPSFLKMFGQDQPALIVEKAVSIAQSVTGTVNPEAAIAAIQASDELKQRYIDAAEARAIETLKLYISDLQDARNHDIEITKIKGSNRRGDWIVGLTVLGIAACMTLAVAMTGLNEFAKSILNIAIGVFLSNWQQINAFEFGSNKNSKSKDEVINTLINK